MLRMLPCLPGRAKGWAQVLCRVAAKIGDYTEEMSMDVSSIASAASALQSQRVGDAVGISVMRKALDIEAQGALQLLQALPQPTQALPPNLGNYLNVSA